MNELVVKNVNLFGDSIVTAQDKDGQIWAGVRWLCNGMGLSRGQMNNESTKIKEDVVLKEGARNLVLPTKGGKQEVLCLRHDFIPLWIAKITVTPSMKENNPELVDKLVQYQLKAKDILAEAFLPKKKEKPEKSKSLPLPSVNTMVKNVAKYLEKAGVDDLYIAAEMKRIYTDSGYPVNAPLITDKETMPKLYDCTEIAKELGIYSTSGKPHSQAVGAIIKKLHIEDSEIVTTAFSRNGHDDVTTQYKPSVFEDVKLWLAENNYPTKIIYIDSKGNQKTCTVAYQEVA